jgi:hypothetical protein
VNRAYYAVYLYAADKYSQAKGNDPSIEAIIRNHARFIKELKLEASQPTSCKTVYAFMMQMCWKSSASNTL